MQFMSNFFTKYLNRTKNRICSKFKKEITDISKGQYAIVMDALEHENNYILGDILTGEIFIHIPDENTDDEKGKKELFIVLTNTKVIISNHVFPTLGDVDEFVAARVYNKAKLKLSSIRQAYKAEQLKNIDNLIYDVRNNIRESRKKARLNIQKNHQIINQ